MPAVSMVIYTASAGPILPELQWHEELVITRAGATLTRTGRIDGTQVNVGRWEVSVDEARAAALFAQLERVNRRAIRRVETNDAPEGGGSETYTLFYAGGRRLELLFDPGTTYTHGESVVAPVQDLIRELALPPEAVSRYRVR